MHPPTPYQPLIIDRPVSSGGYSGEYDNNNLNSLINKESGQQSLIPDSKK